MKNSNFFSELRRRNVYKVAVAYAVVGWLIAQIATQIFPFLEIPNWVVRLVIVLIAIGFPIALVIAWAFEATPEGIKRTEVADAMPAVAGQKKHVWIYVVVIGAAISVALFFLGRYTAGSGTPRQSEAATVSAKSIAVLPFDNLSRDPDNAFFAEGVQDEILTCLAKVADLKVIARTSTQKFKSVPTDLRDVAKQLDVTNILEGSVQKVNDQVRVNVQLINALTNAHLWAEIYDRKLTDIFAVESDIAKTIADALQAKLTGSEKQMMAAQPTSDTVAYELYHKGRSLWGKRTGDNILKAIAFLSRRSRAIQITRWLTQGSPAPTFYPRFTLAQTGARRVRKRKRLPSKLSVLIPISLKHTRRWEKCSSLAKSIWPEPRANTNERSSSSQTMPTHIIGSATIAWQRSGNSTRPSPRANARLN